MSDTFGCPEAEFHGNPFRYCRVEGCGWHEPIPPPDGLALIAAERKRQVEVEGWTPEHDDAHGGNDLAAAAAAYANWSESYPLPDDYANGVTAPPCWPWDDEWWKPSDDPIRNLVKAGALIVAEIDRLQRAAKS